MGHKDLIREMIREEFRILKERETALSRVARVGREVDQAYTAGKRAGESLVDLDPKGFFKNLSQAATEKFKVCLMNGFDSPRCKANEVEGFSTADLKSGIKVLANDYAKSIRNDMKLGERSIIRKRIQRGDPVELIVKDGFKKYYKRSTGQDLADVHVSVVNYLVKQTEFIKRESRQDKENIIQERLEKWSSLIQEK